MFVQLCGNYNGTSCNSGLANSSKLSLSVSPYTTRERSSKVGSKGEAMDRHLAHARLGVISFGLAIGLAWALSVVLLAVMAAAFDWGIIFAAALQNLYIGFGPNFVGAIAGAVWGFVHGFLFGILIAFFYNRLLTSRYVHHFEQQDEIER